MADDDIVFSVGQILMMHERALHCPYLQRMFAMIKTGTPTADAIVDTLLTMSNANESQRADLAALYARLPSRR